MRENILRIWSKPRWGIRQLKHIKTNGTYITYKTLCCVTLGQATKKFWGKKAD